MKRFSLDMIVKNCSLKVMHVTQLLRNQYKHFQDCS